MPFDIAIHIDPRIPHQLKAARLMQQGFAAHGLFAAMTHEDARPADLAVIWSDRNRRVIELQREEGRPYLAMERGYIGEGDDWVSLGFNGVHGRAVFAHQRDAGQRWKRHFEGCLSPWKGPSGKVLVVGQAAGPFVEGDALADWYDAVIRELRGRGLEVVFRPPADPAKLHWTSILGEVPWDIRPPAEVIRDARFVVTFSSAMGVRAVLSGVPVVACCRGSMAWAVSSHSLRVPLWESDRTEWAHTLAFAQWSSAEIESGVAWDALRHVYERL
jgi:hypothetical protein